MQPRQNKSASFIRDGTIYKEKEPSTPAQSYCLCDSCVSSVRY